VATYAMAYDCIVVRAYVYCHLSRYIMSVVFCSLIPLVVSASLNSQYLDQRSGNAQVVVRNQGETQLY
jgi:hypothetical protein